MNAICLVVDRLHAGFLGAYGNAWIETPSLDRLACEAFTFDQMLIDNARLESVYRSYWHGWHALCPELPPPQRPCLAEMLRDANVRTALLTDERAVAEHPLAVQFDQRIDVDPPWQPRQAEEVEQTHLARCFVQAIDYLQSADEPFLLWCHLAGLGTAWDAPQEFRQAYWEEGDPKPPDSIDVPELTLPEDHDPDQLLGITQAYAGQVSLFDTCLGAFLEFIDGSPLAEETLVVLTSPRGFPLGEHGRVGPCDGALYGELVHVPLMIRFPDRLAASARSHGLVEPADLWATLLNWWRIGPLPPSPSSVNLLPIIRQEVDASRDRLCISGDATQRAVRTPAWYLRRGDRVELFAKPDDRWEVNDVSDRCQDIVQDLLDVLDQYEQTLYSGPVNELSPLGEILRSGLD